ncbi:hypothetical protein EF72_21440 [Salmonella enterica]|nr:hypothetical protein [Salmonella enterica]
MLTNIATTDATFADLDYAGPNAESTRLFLAGNAVEFSLPGYEAPDGYRFMFASDLNQYRLVTTSDTPETVYVFQHDDNDPTRLIIFRYIGSQHDGALVGLVRGFFGWILACRSIIVHGPDLAGPLRRFWHMMSSWALTEGYGLEAVSPAGQRALIRTEAQLADFINEFRFASHAHFRLVIRQEERRFNA